MITKRMRKKVEILWLTRAAQNAAFGLLR